MGQTADNMNKSANNMGKAANDKAWLFAVPAFAVAAAITIVALIVAGGHAVLEIGGPDGRAFVGLAQVLGVLRDPALYGALLRSIVFSSSALAIELPLGVAVALAMPRRGVGAAGWIIVMALPLVTPWGVTGMMWKIVGDPHLGLSGGLFGSLAGGAAIPAWAMVVVMDVWHWTPLVALLCHAGLRAIPETHYRAARIDGASAAAVFRYVELPAIRRPMLIAVVFRIADSLAIYAEPLVMSGGGPGGRTTYFAQFLAELGLARFEMGAAGALSVLYLVAAVPLVFLCYRALAGAGRGGRR